MELLQQEAKQKPGGWAIMIALDQQNAFQELDKVAAQAVMDQWAEDLPALTPLARLHRASVGQPVDVYMRSSTSTTGVDRVCEMTEGGAQGSTITGMALSAVLDGPLKSTMQEYDGVVCTAIANDCDLVLTGSDDDDHRPELMFGGIGDEDGGALGHFTRAVNEVNLKLNRKKCQCYIQAETDETRQAIAALMPPWLRRTFKITNDETKAGYDDIMDQIDAAKLAVKRAAGTDDEQTATAEL